MRPLTFPLLAFTAIAILTGCGSSDFHAVEGKVTVPGATQFTFAGDVLELRQVENPLQRAFGQIEPDGSFHIETLDEGKIATGTKPGAYEARIVLSDDDPQHVKIASKAIHRKFTRFETSGLKIQVPSDNITLQITPK